MLSDMRCDWATGGVCASMPMSSSRATCAHSSVMFLGGVIGLSLINSIFVDAMAEDNNDEVLEKLRRLEEKIDQLSKTPKE